MQVVVGIDNETKEPIRLEVEVEWDFGPYISLVAKDTDQKILLDVSIPDPASWNEMTKKTAEKFLEVLDTGSDSR